MYDGSRFIEPLSQAGAYTVDQDDVSKIILSRDGVGPMGWYDVIHVFYGDDETPGVSMPAHLTAHWKPE